ncbi:hypothetical protein K9L97_00960 [Candidatus Woesearchaeota archaeon]|nr:hypothetical protein [Candidatus Woesearchaeota archaeon]
MDVESIDEIVTNGAFMKPTGETIYSLEDHKKAIESAIKYHDQLKNTIKNDSKNYLKTTLNKIKDIYATIFNYDSKLKKDITKDSPKVYHMKTKPFISPKIDSKTSNEYNAFNQMAI